MLHGIVAELQHGYSASGIHLPPQTDAGTKTALSQLYEEISKQETTHPEVALLVAGDFNAGKLKSVSPNLYQHVKCATRGIF